MVLIKHEGGRGGHTVGPPFWGVAPLVGVVQITFSLCSVLYCLPARWRGPWMKGCPGVVVAGGLPGVGGTLKVSMWPSLLRAGDPAWNQGRNCAISPTLGPTHGARRSPTALALRAALARSGGAQQGVAAEGPAGGAACPPGDPAACRGGSCPVQAAAPAPFGSVSCVPASGASVRGLGTGAVAYLRP